MVKLYFIALMATKKWEGKLEISHSNETLNIVVSMIS